MDTVGEKQPTSPENDAASSSRAANPSQAEPRVRQIQPGVCHDERPKGQEECNASQGHYYDLYELAPVGYVILCTKGLIREANRTAVMLFGVSREELLNQPLIRFIRQDDADIFAVKSKECLSDCASHLCELRMLKPDGTLFWAQLAVTGFQQSDGPPLCQVTLSDITEHKQVEAVMAARLRLLQAANSQSLNQLLQATLDEAEVITNSLIGFYHFLQPDQETLSLQAWSTNTIEHVCRAEGAGLQYPVRHAGVWVDCLKSRQPVVHNDYPSLPHKKGLPPGHAPVIRELVVPVMRADKIVALLGVGNKPTEYNGRDVEAVASLADLAWDIAERKRVETILQESEERYRLLFESATDAMFLMANDTYVIVKANRMASELYGYDPNELLTKTGMDFSADPEETRRLFGEAQVNPNRIVHIPFRLHRKKDGTIFPVEFTGRAIPLQGRPALFIAVRDISERMAAEAALRESEQQRRREQEAASDKLKEQAENLASIYQALDSVGLIVSELNDNDARIKIFNAGAEKLLGYRQEEVIGQSIALLYPVGRSGLIPGGVKRLRGGKAMHSFNMTLIRSSGECFPAILSIHPFDCQKGQCRKAVAIFRDISELMGFQQQLEAMNEDLERRVEQRTCELQETQKQYLHAEKLSAIGKLSASIAHEFNNPLQGILAILKGLKKRAILEEEDRVLLDAAIGESDRIKELIRGLQEFNRPSSGRKAPMDVHKALDSMLLLHKNDFKGKRIRVERQYAEDLPQILAVPDQIKQVFLNLLTNAADACRTPGGVITVSTRHEQNRVAITITDTGIGIKPEEMGLIFQPFYTTKPEVKGTGLGLSVSHGIVENHGGAILVESQPGEGASFTVLLPIKHAEEAALTDEWGRPTT
jgi:PAS domain S-box-containing protein